MKSFLIYLLLSFALLLNSSSFASYIQFKNSTDHPITFDSIGKGHWSSCIRPFPTTTAYITLVVPPQTTSARYFIGISRSSECIFEGDSRLNFIVYEGKGTGGPSIGWIQFGENYFNHQWININLSSKAKKKYQGKDLSISDGRMFELKTRDGGN